MVRVSVSKIATSTTTTTTTANLSTYIVINVCCLRTK